MYSCFAAYHKTGFRSNSDAQKSVLYFVVIIMILGLFVRELNAKSFNVGAGLHYYKVAGNIYLDRVIIEPEVYIGFRRQNGSAWRFTFSQISPQVKSDITLDQFRQTSIWIVRSAGLNIPYFKSLINAGFGLSEVMRTYETGRDLSGALSFRADIEKRVYSSHGLDYVMGITFRGNPLPHSDWFTDRLGISISIVSSASMTTEEDTPQP